MIDVHILTLPDEDKTLLKECLKSLDEENISIHLVDGVEGHVGRGRAKAIQKGTNEWIGWVDSDDFIIPGAYNKMINQSKENPEIGFWWMNEEVWDLLPSDLYAPVNKYTSVRPHHIHIIHRDLIDYDIIEGIKNDFGKILNKLSINHGKHINETGYVWRQYNKSSCRKRNFNRNKFTARTCP